MSYEEPLKDFDLTAAARFDRTGARHIAQEHIDTFARFTQRAGELKTPCFNDPDLFFPDPSDKDMARRAKAACQRCPMIDACLNFALDARQNDGVWGGMDEGERRAILKYRRAMKQKQWKRQREARARANETPLFELPAGA
jgi:WhiB family redox-sensing transcriptional regulator